jgi:hypothetical protein
MLPNVAISTETNCATTGCNSLPCARILRGILVFAGADAGGGSVALQLERYGAMVHAFRQATVPGSASFAPGRGAGLLSLLPSCAQADELLSREIVKLGRLCSPLSIPLTSTHAFESRPGAAPSQGQGGRLGAFSLLADGHARTQQPEPDSRDAHISTAKTSGATHKRPFRIERSRGGARKVCSSDLNCFNCSPSCVPGRDSGPAAVGTASGRMFGSRSCQWLAVIARRAMRLMGIKVSSSPVNSSI